MAKRREPGSLGAFLGDLWDAVKEMKVSEVVDELRENGRVNAMAKLAKRRMQGEPIDAEGVEVKPAGTPEEVKKP